MENLIELKNISVRFGTKNTPTNAVKNATLSVAKGDIYGIVGYSGAGKSTLSRTINLLQKPTSGTVRVNNTIFFDEGKQQISTKELQQQRQKIGMIFQHFNLLNEMTVAENIEFALYYSKLSAQALTNKVKNLLKLVDLEDKADFYPAQLSGGEQQRVAIARALANDPSILISDESTSALDPQNTTQILELLRKLNQQYGLTILLITHEMDVVKQIANKIAIMQHGEIIEQGKLEEIYFHPREELTKQFVGGSLAALQVLRSFNLKPLSTNERLYKLVFKAATITQSIILDLYKELAVDVSMLYGNIEILDNAPVGTMIVLVTGEKMKLDEVPSLLKKRNVEVIKIDDRRVWDDTFNS